MNGLEPKSLQIDIKNVYISNIDNVYRISKHITTSYQFLAQIKKYSFFFYDDVGSAGASMEWHPA